MKGMSIVITGGAGFIGSHLAHALSEGNDVVVVDDLSAGKIENIKSLIESRQIRFIHGSVTNKLLMNRTCKDVDYVFHHAAIASVPKSMSNPLATNDVGINGTLITLIAARDGGARKVVFASSAGVYGDRVKPPINEDSPPDPLSPYALTKVVGEQYCALFKQLYGLNTISLRYFNVFGPRQNPKSDYAAVIPSFFSRALSGKSLIIHGDGEQTRDFVFIDDVVRANLLAAESNASGEFNIASGNGISINELADTMLKLTNKHVRIVHDEPRKGDPRHSVADTSKARKFLRFVPKHSLSEGLKLTIDAFA